MKDLKCGLKDCKFNRGYSCCSKAISVTGGTDCATYSPDPVKSGEKFEASGEFVKPDYTVDTAVSCNADCVFNREGKCVSVGITVMGEGDKDACCLTFVKK